MPPWIHILVMWTGNKKVHEGADGKTDETQADAKDASFEIVCCRAPLSLSYFGQCTLPRWLLVCLPRSHPWGSSVFKAWGSQEHSVAKQEELMYLFVQLMWSESRSWVCFTEVQSSMRPTTSLTTTICLVVDIFIKVLVFWKVSSDHIWPWLVSVLRMSRMSNGARYLAQLYLDSNWYSKQCCLNLWGISGFEELAGALQSLEFRTEELWFSSRKTRFSKLSARDRLFGYSTLITEDLSGFIVTANGQISKDCFLATFTDYMHLVQVQKFWQ